MAIAECLACKSRRNHPLYHWTAVPLSVLGLPRSQDEAEQMATLEMDLRRCAMCGHVFHTEFDYEKIPYRTGSNLVFNKAHYWHAYQAALAEEWIRALEIRGKRVVEIGCGDGTFLRHFVAAGNTCVAYEPGPDADLARRHGITVHQEYFQASRLHESRPDFIVCRHVLEHLADPLDFLQDIALTGHQLGLRPVFLGEVPQIDKALAQRRINDFLYEHVSNFTQNSFRTLFERAGYEVAALASRHDDEVVTVVARPTPPAEALAIRAASRAFHDDVAHQTEAVRRTLDAWQHAERRVALWGATGKAAAMINMFGFSRERFPVVVDSDPRKVGAYVPGTGQQIAGPDALVRHPVDAILICTQWRARDIEHEVRHVHGLGADLFVYHRGAIVPLTPELKL